VFLLFKSKDILFRLVLRTFIYYKKCIDLFEKFQLPSGCMNMAKQKAHPALRKYWRQAKRKYRKKKKKS